MGSLEEYCSLHYTVGRTGLFSFYEKKNNADQGEQQLLSGSEAVTRAQPPRRAGANDKAMKISQD